MTRWDWTWEERSQKARAPTVEPDASSNADAQASADTAAGGGWGPREPSQTFRRRRIGAAAVLVVLLAILISALSSHKGSASKLPPAKRHALALSPSQAERSAATVKAEQKAINSVLAYTPAVTSGGSSGSEVALTFDDGPGPYTPQLVAELNRLHVHATFFVIGNQEQYFSAGTVAEINSGDVIGDH